MIVATETVNEKQPDASSVLGYARYAMRVWLEDKLNAVDALASGYPAASWEGRVQDRAIAETKVKPAELERRAKHGPPFPAMPHERRHVGSQVPRGVTRLYASLADNVDRALEMLPYMTARVVQIQYLLGHRPVAERADEVGISTSQYWVEHKAGMWFLAGRLSAISEVSR